MVAADCSATLESAFEVAPLAADMEALLDGLCCERAGLPARPAAEQQAFRAAALHQLTAMRASAAAAAACVLDGIDAARPLSARDRWLERAGAGAAGSADRDALAWATKVSELWGALPEASRRDYSAAVRRVQLDLARQRQQARQLQDLVEEADVFLGNLEPCSRCHQWDPWVEVLGQGSRGVRLCRNCRPPASCGDVCGEKAPDRSDELLIGAS